MTKRQQVNSRFGLNATRRLCLAVVLFGLTAYLASHGELVPGEEAVFNAIYGLPEILLPFFLVITQLGNIFVLFGLGVFCMYKQQFHITIRLLLSGGLAYVLAGIAKDLLGRPRPVELINELVTRDLLIRGPGFPSGHAALATAIALTLSPHLSKKYRWVVPVLIAGVGLSRVYLGVHAPLDVIGGIAIGWAAAELLRHVTISASKQPQSKQN